MLRRVVSSVAKVVRMTATLEEMADPQALRALREAQADTKAGRMYTYREVFGHPPPRERRKKRRRDFQTES